MRELTLRTCQGVGDALWCVQLALPHVTSLHLRVLQVGTGDRARQDRALAFLRLVSGVASVEPAVTAPAHYHRLATQRFSLDACLRAGTGDFAVNAALESGERLEALGAGGQCVETLAIRTAHCPDLPARYLALYVSGDTMRATVRRSVGLWEIAAWADLVRGLYDRLKLPGDLVVLGASYDRDAARALELSLGKVARVRVLLDRPAAEVCDVIRRADTYVGYQSGLSVLADQFDVPRHLMVYFPHLARMVRSWPKPKNLASGSHHPVLFSQVPREVLDALPASWT